MGFFFYQSGLTENKEQEPVKQQEQHRMRKQSTSTSSLYINDIIFLKFMEKKIVMFIVI